MKKNMCIYIYSNYHKIARHQLEPRVILPRDHGTLGKGKPKAYKSVAVDAVVVKFLQISSR